MKNGSGSNVMMKIDSPEICTLNRNVKIVLLVVPEMVKTGGRVQERSFPRTIGHESTYSPQMIRAALKNEMTVMLKSSPADLVTETDQKVESMIISSIKEKFPSHRFPFVAVSIGFAVKKELEFGIVYSCVEDKMYTGRKGKGAFCNGQPLKVSEQQDITKSLILTELGSSRTPEVMKTILSNMDRLLSIPVHGLRAVGSAAVNMCLVATGAVEAYYEIGIHCWDIAAGAVIVQEAGGIVMDVNGGPLDLMSRRIIAANSQAIGQRIAKEIQVFSCERDDAE
ncbi:IMPA1 monophosphatase, partial [Polypterus senegalus]